MSSWFHFELFDFAAAEALSEEARDLGRSANFQPPVLSASVDLIFNFTRRRDISRAEANIETLASEIAQTRGAHEWLWKLRLAQVRSELLLARHNYEQAVANTQSVVDMARAGGRGKYEALGLWIRGQALHALGRTHEGVAELRNALGRARKLGDPALLLHIAAALLGIEGDSTTLAEASATVGRILSSLPDEAMRRRFEEAPSVQLVRRLDRAAS